MKQLVKSVICTIGFLFSHGAVAYDHMPKGNFGWFGVTGNFQDLGDGQMYWMGEFSGTFFSDDTAHPLHEASVRCPGWMDFNVKLDTSKLAGYCLIKDTVGDEATFFWNGGGKANGSGGEWTWIRGTGKYDGLSGKPGGTWRGFTVSNWNDGYASGYAYWNK